MLMVMRPGFCCALYVCLLTSSIACNLGKGTTRLSASWQSATSASSLIARAQSVGSKSAVHQVSKELCLVRQIWRDSQHRRSTFKHGEKKCPPVV